MLLVWRGVTKVWLCVLLLWCCKGVAICEEALVAVDNMLATCVILGALGLASSYLKLIY